MPGQQTRTRQQTVIPFQANSLVASQQLGLGMMYRELYLTLAGPIDAGAAITHANLKNGDEWACVKRIDIVANGTDNIRSITGEELRMWNLFMYDRAPRLVQGWVGAGGHPVAFKSTLILPFWMQKSRKPLDTILNSAKLSDLRVNITWGDATSITSAATPSFTVAPTMTITSRESFGISGKFSVWRWLRLQDANVLAQDEYTVLLPLGNMYRGFMINCKDTNGVDLVDAIDKVELRSGTNVYFSADPRIVRDQYIINWDMEAGLADSTGAENKVAISDNTKIDGWTYIDLIDDGYLSEAIDTLSLSELKLVFKVNQTVGQFTVSASQIIPVRTQSN